MTQQEEPLVHLEEVPVVQDPVLNQQRVDDIAETLTKIQNNDDSNNKLFRDLLAVTHQEDSSTVSAEHNNKPKQQQEQLWVSGLQKNIREQWILIVE